MFFLIYVIILYVVNLSDSRPEDFYMDNSRRRGRAEFMFGSLGNLPGLKDTDIATSALIIDVAQAKFLQSFFNQAAERKQDGRDEHDCVFLKGGKALGLMNLVDRRTKDLDFNISPSLGMQSLVKMLDRAASEVGRLGLLKEFQWAPVKSGAHDAMSHKWRIEGKLNNGSQFQLYVECTRRNDMPEGSYQKISVDQTDLGVPVFEAIVMTPVAIAAGKTTAVLDRNNPRDILDLYILTTHIKVEPPIELLASMGKKALVSLYDRLEEQKNSVSWATYSEMVLPYIGKSMLEEYGSEAKLIEMRDEVFDVVEKWMSEAIQLAEDFESDGNHEKHGLRI